MGVKLRDPKEYIGETNTNRSGEQMTIVTYRSGHDIDVKFEDGTIRKHCYYYDFKRGMISKIKLDKKIRAQRIIGEISYSNAGERMKVVDYNDCENIVVEFDDGTIRVTTYKQFKDGSVSKEQEDPHKYIGLRNISKSGESMVVIDARNSHDIDVQFEDGTVRTGCVFTAFKSGSIPKTKKTVKEYLKIRVGEKKVMCTGEEFEITDYNGSEDITVRCGDFEKHTTYSEFRKGTLTKRISNIQKNSESRIGEINFTKNKEKITIIDYRGSDDVDVQFEDGSIRRNVSYFNFQHGSVKKFTGETLFWSQAEKNNKVTVLDSYKGQFTPLKCQCNFCKRILYMKPMGVRQNQGCKSCSIINARAKKIMKHEEFIKLAEELNEHFVVIGKYKNTSTNVKCKCRHCKKISYVLPKAILKNGGCRFCCRIGTSYPEQFLFNCFSKIFGYQNVRNRDRKTIGKELDIYIPKMNVAIEYGAWHWHKNRLESDHKKMNLCDENGIKLLRIYGGCKNKFPKDENGWIFVSDTCIDRDESVLLGIVNMVCTKIGIDFDGFSNKDIKDIKKKTMKIVAQMIDMKIKRKEAAKAA